MEQKYLSHYSK